VEGCVALLRLQGCLDTHPAKKVEAIPPPAAAQRGEGETQGIGAAPIRVAGHDCRGIADYVEEHSLAAVAAVEVHCGTEAREDGVEGVASHLVRGGDEQAAHEVVAAHRVVLLAEHGADHISHL
jgi:hypothetical protein